MNIPLLLTLVTELYQQASKESSQPADEIVHYYFKQRHFLGKRDRKAISELFWHIMRHKSRFEWHSAEAASPTMSTIIPVEELAVRAYRDLYPISPEPDFRKEDAISQAWKQVEKNKMQKKPPDPVTYSLPEWMWTDLEKIFDHETLHATATSLLKPAGLHLRVNTLKAKIEDVTQACPEYTIHKGNLLPEALRMQGNPDIRHHKIFRQGWVEIQDEGSQLITRFIQPQAGDYILDACAGAGGKSLHLAALTQNQARIIATDKYPERLMELMHRASRTDARILVMDQKEVFKTLQGKADIVFLDVPCSGSGTFRRRPDLKWNLTRGIIQNYVELQRKILQENIPLLKPGGRLIYATCSILPEENEGQMEYIMKTWPHLKPVPISDVIEDLHLPLKPSKTPWLRISPQDFDTDGYFVGIMK
ncbi:MAG: rRNA (cytosine967-C5)-methyltransferase [Candidatus Marinimicrobia bacterium]|nr:rRNA (cytosine967-C5)-methyltransferase [Candidatus Neomarinimicrobiota bacterium]